MAMTARVAALPAMSLLTIHAPTDTVTTSLPEDPSCIPKGWQKGKTNFLDEMQRHVDIGVALLYAVG